MPNPIEFLRCYYRALRYSARACKILLVDQRYFASVRSGEYRDRDDNYLPWFTFGAIEALKNWDLSEKRVFEYGAGYSTLFWALRAKEVISVEHDSAWQEKIASLAPGTAQVLHAPLVRKYQRHHPTPEALASFARYAEAIRDRGMFDIIVLDGFAGSRVRYRCARAALSHLRPTGLVILDNSDWLPGTALYLRTAGLIEVDLSGPGPGNWYCHTTSFFFTRGFDFRSAGPRQPRVPVGGIVANWEATLERELLEGTSSTVPPEPHRGS